MKSRLSELRQNLEDEVEIVELRSKEEYEKISGSLDFVDRGETTATGEVEIVGTSAEVEVEIVELRSREEYEKLSGSLDFVDRGETSATGEVEIVERR